MMYRLPLTGILVGLLLIGSTTPASAQDPASYGSCRRAVDWLGWKAQREYRSALFGLKKARDAGAMEIRFGSDRSIWIKGLQEPTPVLSAEVIDEWHSLTKGYGSNALVDGETDLRPRTGIFETRRRLSTELIPYIAQAYRAFECRLDQICMLLAHSDRLQEENPQDVTVEVLGCDDVETQTIKDCHLPANNQQVVAQGQLREYCKTMTDRLRIREIALTKEIVEYDAGYRSALQLSGIMRAFLEEMRGTVMGSLHSAAELMISLSRIPCFIGSCDNGSSASAQP